MARKALIVVSPAAAAGVRSAVLRSLERHLAAAEIPFEVLEPRAGEPFGALVRSRLADGFDLVAAAGGDGTVSAVIDGLAGTGVPLGIVPMGTANLVARELNIPLDLEEASALIAAPPRMRMLDAMKIADRVYVLVAGVGVSASVAGGTTRRNKRRFGLIAYVGAAILKAFELRRRHLEVEVDGVARRYRAVEVAVANCGILARMLFPKGPDIHADDGHLDVWILGAKTILDYPRYLGGIIMGRPSNPRIHFLEARRSIAVRSAVPVPVQADGDVIGTTPVEMLVLPGAVRVIVPETPAVEPGRDLARDLFLGLHLAGPARAFSRDERERSGRAAPASRPPSAPPTKE
jgi:diacylglycerol kinase (ATP)